MVMEMLLDFVELGWEYRSERGAWMSHMGVALAVPACILSLLYLGISGPLRPQVDVCPLCAGPGPDASEAL